MRTDRSRKALHLCSSLAIATALLAGASAARAQSFQGNGTFNSGSGSITTGTGTTTIQINSTDAVIDWTTFDTATGTTPIDFQPVGTTATFQRVGQDFSVLNRIFPTDPSRAIQFNGTVIAQIQSTTSVPGGTVYFYSPGGIIIGSTAVFNVGNLGLTSIAPQVVGGVFEQAGANGEFVNFNGAVTPGSAVTIQPGAQITGTAPGTGSYLAVVAPVVSNAGAIGGKRGVAMVSADAATLTFNPNGLFDIQVSSGTSGTGTTLSHSGSISGPAGDLGNASRIYLVAVPKNTAITMAIASGSTLGFDIADAADVDGNAIVLSGGFDVVGGQVQSTPSGGGGTGQVSVFANPAAVTSAMSAATTGEAKFFANAGQTSSYASNLSVAGTQYTSDPNAIAVQVFSHDPNSQLNIAGNLSVTALDPTVVAPASGFQVTNFAVVDAINGGNMAIGGNVTVTNEKFGSGSGAVTTGSARLAVNTGSQLTVGGNATVIARAQGGNATGGNAGVFADNGGLIDIGGVLRVRADGFGGPGASGTGGTASVSAQTGGDISANELNLTAQGNGGNDSGSGAGSGTGGSTLLTASGTGSTIAIANGNSTGANPAELLFMNARGFGGETNGGGSGVGGTGTGGNATITVTDGATLTGPANVGTQGFVGIFARGFGGNANVANTTGGAAIGGNINITVDSATMTSANMVPSSFAQAGSAATTATGDIAGGNATGGTRNISIRNGASVTAAFGGGGPGAQGGSGLGTGRGGDGTGGSASLVVENNATLNLTGSTAVFSQNSGGAGGAAGTSGNGIAGSAFVRVANGSTLTMAGPATNAFSVNANAILPVAPAPSLTGQNSTGGTATFIIDNATANLQSVDVTALGQGGGGQVSTGGNGTGGTATLQLIGATLTADALDVEAMGVGGSLDSGQSGVAGNGTGGTAQIIATGGANTLNVATLVDVNGDGLGGDIGGAAGTTTGDAVGGLALLLVNGGASLTVTAPRVDVSSDGEGGEAIGATDFGGDGMGGSARVVADGGNLTINGELEIEADNDGGEGAIGGNALQRAGTDPNALLFARNGSITVTGLTTLVSTGEGSSSSNGNGGSATGGIASVFVTDDNGATGDGVINLADLDISTVATGGSASGTGSGGSALGGDISVNASGGQIAISGVATLSADGNGGFSDGALAGTGTGGRTNLSTSFAGSAVTVGGNLFLTAQGFGGNAFSSGTAGGAGIGGQAEVGNFQGGSVTIGGFAIVDADGQGGQADGAGANGGNGTGGIAQTYQDASGDLTFNSDLTLTANGSGGSAFGTGGRGGDGQGGQARAILYNTGASNLTVLGSLLGQAKGFGAGTIECTVCGVGSGNATGGTARLGADAAGKTVTIGGSVMMDTLSDVSGADGSVVGNATGGASEIFSRGSTVNIAGSAIVDSGAFAGTNLGAGNGGSATGGNAFIGTANGVPGSVLNIGAGVSAFADAVGGDATGGGNGGNANAGGANIFAGGGSLGITGDVSLISTAIGGTGVNGGAAMGGTAAISSNGGALAIDASGVESSGISLSASGTGGGTSSAGGRGGDGRGGNSRIGATNGGSVDLFGAVLLDSGGFTTDLGTDATDGGDGFGGIAAVSQNTGGDISITGDTTLVVAGFGGANYGGGDRIAGTGQGGDGRIVVNDAGGVTIDGNANISAGGFGGAGLASTGVSHGGGGFGGLANIGSVNGANTITGQAQIFAIGEGGDATLDGLGGDGTGGQALIGTVPGATAGSISIGGNGGFSTASASASGGAGAGGGFGGNAFSGVAQVFATGGDITIADAFLLSADSLGGSAVNGNGGNAVSNLALINATSGTVALTNPAQLVVSASATGGSAAGAGNGGFGQAGRARLFVDGGDIAVAGDLFLDGRSFGGDGVNGGDAVGPQPFRQPRALIAGFAGNISVAGTASLSSAAFGGNATTGFGGNGGLAFAGDSAVDAQSNSGFTTITLGALTVDASAVGGFGGDGVGSLAGGLGGDAYAGFVGVQGNAGRGDLTITGDSVISASAFGGDGGFGGSGGSTAPGANGGAGGRAIAGGITLGTVSGFATPENDGSASFGNVTGDANAFGGAGGDGGTGTTQGVGGAGGEAFGGSVGILVRGSPVTMGDVSLTGLGIGGDGGAGSVQGVGGDGYAGDGFLIATQRFMRTERGTLNAGAVTLSTAGIGGAGATVGDSFFSAANGAETELFVRQADVTLASFELTTSGALAPNFTTTILSVIDPATGVQFPDGLPRPASVTIAAQPYDINLTQGTVDVSGAFTMVTPGDMRVSLDSSTMNLGSLTLSAGNFVLPAARPATLGTITVAGALSISSGLDFRAFANFNAGGDGFLSADGSVETGDLIFAGDLGIDALGSITTGNVDAGDVFFTAGQAIATGAVLSDEGIELTTPGGTITTGQLTAGDDVVVSAGGAVTVAGASAGLVNPSNDPAAEYNVVLRSLTSINAGDLAARGSVGIGSGGAIAVGNVSTGAAGIGFLALAGTGLTTGAIDTTGSPGGGRVYVGNFSMEPLGGELGGTFDPNPILATTPVGVAGPVTINGAVATGKLQAAATQSLTITGATTANDFVALTTGGVLTTGAIQAANAINALANGGIAAGNLTAGTALTVQSNGAVQTGALQSGANLLAGSNQTLATGNVTATGDATLQAMGAIQAGAIAAGQGVFINGNGSVTTQAIDAGNRVAIQAMGVLNLGNITAGIVNPSTATGAVYRIGLAGNSITTGDLTARNGVLVGSTLTLTTGNIAGSEALLLAGTGITTGGITAGTFNPSTGTRGTNGRVLLANSSMGALGGTFTNFDPNPVFAAIPVAVAGSVSVSGPIAANTVAAAATQGFAAQAITAGTSIDIVAGGLAAVNGAWRAPSIELASGDIAIASGGSLDAMSAAGSILLVSTGGSGATIGDGVSGSGYALGNDEFSRIRAGEIAILAPDNSSVATDMTIGTLTINASQLYDSSGLIVFGTGDTATLTPGGTLRIAGAVTANGFAPTNEIDFATGTFELETANGSLKVNNGSGALGGFVSIDANRIHVADDAILAKLRVDPKYEGHVVELNAPAAVTRSDGVLNALALDLEGNETIYIQNVGTGTVPAGFVTTLGEDTDIGPEEAPSGGTKVVINGQLQTESGLLTGQAAYDAAKADAIADLEAGETFASDLDPLSTFNNCVIVTGVCSLGSNMAAAPPASEITVVTGAGLDDSPTAPTADDSDEGEDGSSEDQDEESDSDEGSSPIAPPTPLISTRSLDPDVTVVEPVSGAGNPALFGSAVNEAAPPQPTAQGDEQ